MKRHTNKHIKNFGVVLLVLAVVMGVGAFCRPTWAAKTMTEETDVKFTLNSSINLTVDKEQMTIESLLPGTAGESEPVTVTVDTNAATGYYLSATAGTKEGTTDLTSEDAPGAKIVHLGVEDDLEGASQIDANKWGVAYAVGEADLASSHYTGLPLDGEDSGASGKKLIDAENLDGEKVVKVKVGVKADRTLMKGEYKNVVNFYAVAK